MGFAQCPSQSPLQQVLVYVLFLHVAICLMLGSLYTVTLWSDWEGDSVCVFSSCTSCITELWVRKRRRRNDKEDNPEKGTGNRELSKGAGRLVCCLCLERGCGPPAGTVRRV